MSDHYAMAKQVNASWFAIRDTCPLKLVRGPCGSEYLEPDMRANHDPGDEDDALACAFSNAYRKVRECALKRHDERYPGR